MQWNHTWGIGIHISYHSTISPLLYWQIFIFIFTGKTATSVTSPNRLLKDGSMPTAGVKSTVSRTKHNYLHSILSSQILWMPPSASLTQLPQPPPPPLVSAFAPEKTTPSNNKGSGTPKIGLIKAKHNKYRNSQVASQKCPVHVTHHDYLHENPKMNQWDAYNTPLTMSMLSQYRWCFLQFLCLLHLCFKQLVFLLI